MDTAIVWIFLLAEIIVSFIFCFWGYKFFGAVMPLYMFLLIFPAMISFFIKIPSMDETVSLIVSIGIAALLAFLVHFLVKLAIFACGGLLGLLIGYILNMFIGLAGTPYIIFMIIMFVVFGIIGYKLRKGIVVIVSALCGAYNLFIYVYFLINYAPSVEHFSLGTLSQMADTAKNVYSGSDFWTAAPIICGVLGIIIQAAVTARNTKHNSKIRNA